MTLLGNALLSKLLESRKYRVLPFPGGRGTGEIIEVYPGATLRTMGLESYKSRPDEAVRLGIAACATAGIKLDIDLRLIALACRYSSGYPEDARLRRGRRFSELVARAIRRMVPRVVPQPLQVVPQMRKRARGTSLTLWFR